MTSSALVRRRTLVGSVLAALLSCLMLVVQAPEAPAAPAASSAATQTGKVRGNIFGQTGGAPMKLKMLYFKGDWTYLGARNVFGSTYSISLPEGSYHLQFVDKRPAYDVKKFAPTDVFVKVQGGRTAVKNVRMRRGAAITGTVRAGGRPAAKARVVAANAAEQSFETVANEQGQFALGGLPAGNYSVFTYDRRKVWVGKSLYVPKLGAGEFANVTIGLARKAGELRVDLYAGGAPLKGTTFATAVSRRTGQFWTAKVANGTVSFRGVFPGRYRIVVNDAGRWFGRTGSVKNGFVRSGRGAFGSFSLTQRGGAFTGLVTREDGTTPMQGAAVRLYDKSGDLVSEVETPNSGRFLVGGRLRAQSDMTVVVFNKYDSDYDPVTIPDLTIGLNQDKSLGTISLQH